MPATLTSRLLSITTTVSHTAFNRFNPFFAAAIICNWTEELLQDLMNTYKDAKDADVSHITMCRDTITNDANRWLLIWGNNHEQQKTNTPPYIR
ncbi:hypothetical protein MUP38_03340 [Candidatus Bathyarchaeota archaeon]|nr:hypothetical protein [Candidatus Bathyarchaeota archaeon]